MRLKTKARKRGTQMDTTITVTREGSIWCVAGNVSKYAAKCALRACGLRGRMRIRVDDNDN